jgi:hypothetical protein
VYWGRMCDELINEEESRSCMKLLAYGLIGMCLVITISNLFNNANRSALSYVIEGSIGSLAGTGYGLWKQRVPAESQPLQNQENLVPSYQTYPV